MGPHLGIGAKIIGRHYMKSIYGIVMVAVTLATSVSFAAPVSKSLTYATLEGLRTSPSQTVVTFATREGFGCVSTDLKPKLTYLGFDSGRFTHQFKVDLVLSYDDEGPGAHCQSIPSGNKVTTDLNAEAAKLLAAQGLDISNGGPSFFKFDYGFTIDVLNDVVRAPY